MRVLSLSRVIIGTGSGDGALSYRLAQSEKKIHVGQFVKGWKRFVGPSAPGPPLQEALAVVKRIGRSIIARRQ